MSKTQKVKVKPVARAVPSAEIVKIEKAVKPIVKAAQALAIRNTDQETEAYEVLRKIKKRQKEIEDKRTSITKPLNKSLKEVNALFKFLSSPLTEADVLIRDKILTFRQKREEQAEARRERIEEKAEEADTEEEAEELRERAEDVTATVGDSQVSKRWTFEEVDLNKVPRKYLLLDTVMVRDEIRDGVREIPGLRIFQKDSVRVT